MRGSSMIAARPLCQATVVAFFRANDGRLRRVAAERSITDSSTAAVNTGMQLPGDYRDLNR